MDINFFKWVVIGLGVAGGIFFPLMIVIRLTEIRDHLAEMHRLTEIRDHDRVSA